MKLVNIKNEKLNLDITLKTKNPKSDYLIMLFFKVLIWTIYLLNVVTLALELSKVEIGILNIMFYGFVISLCLVTLDILDDIIKLVKQYMD